MKKYTLAIVVIYICSSCEKTPIDIPPAPMNVYRMEIEITDNAPFDNLSALFILGRSSEISNPDKDSPYISHYLVNSTTQPNQPDYSFRFLEYTDSLFVPVTAAFGSSNTPEDFFRVRVIKNETLLYEFAGHHLDEVLTLN